MNKFKDLVVWQKSIDLAIRVYEITSSFPASEKYNLVSQANRSAVSVASNIAEGAGRNSNPQFLSFLQFSLGSSYELETQLLLANRLNFLTDEKFVEVECMLNEVQRMLMGLIKKLRT